MTAACVIAAMIFRRPPQPGPAGVFTGLSLYHQFWFADPAATAKVSANNGLREIFK